MVWRRAAWAVESSSEGGWHGVEEGGDDVEEDMWATRSSSEASEAKGGGDLTGGAATQ